MATLHVVTGDQYRTIDRRMREIKRQLDQDGGSPLDPEWVAVELQRIIEGRLGPGEEVSNLLASWQAFYRDLFGLEVDFSHLKVPAKKKGFDRLIVVAQGMTPQRLYDKCAELFPCWKWTDEDLDKIVQSERTAKDGAYAVWFRDGVEADEDLKNLSANDLEKRKIPGITLEERLLMELKYFKETGSHLDIENWTLCSGSRYSDGGVPGVGWGPVGRRLGVDWCHPGSSNPGLRSRRAVF
jgi:hypothetical protein